MRTIIYEDPVFAGLGEHLERDLAIPVEDDTILYFIRGLSIEGKGKIFFS